MTHYVILGRSGEVAGSVWAHSVKPQTENPADKGFWFCDADGVAIASCWFGYKLQSDIGKGL